LNTISTPPDAASKTTTHQASTSASYHVSLPDFYGPMDLLLGLIEQEDLEITQIALAKVTDQYLEYIHTLQTVTPDALTDFLVVAARLVLIKSQVLLPKPPPSVLDPDEEDTTDDLVQQLKDYKRFKQLAIALNDIQATNRRSYVRIAPPPKIEPKLNMDDLKIDVLLDAVRQALAVKPEAPDVGTVVSRETFTIGDQIKTIRQKLHTNRQLSFNELLTGVNSRVEVIVTLLAVLELVKRRVVDVSQIESFGEISIIKKEDAALTEADWEALSQIEDMS